MRTWLEAVVVLAMLAHATAADTLRGQVRAPDHTPLAGATVVASGPALTGVQAEITDEQGGYRMTLPTGTYLLTVFYANRQVERGGVQVAPGVDAVVDVAIDPAPSTSEVITIDGEPHCCAGESCSSNNFAGTTITDEYTTHIPTPAPAPAAKPAPAHGCAHCASDGGDAPAGAALLVLIALRWTRRAPRA